MGDETERKVERGRMMRVLSKVSVEPACILIGLGFSLWGVQASNLYIEKVCKVGSAFFGNGTTYSDEVQSLLHLLLQTIYCLF